MPEASRTRRPKRPPSCHDRALRLLAVRPRSRREMESRLRSAGFDAETVAEELARLEEVGLVDDERFAQEFAEQALGRRLSGRRAVASSLAARGVSRPAIELALQDVEVDDDVRAAELARSRASRLRGLAPEVAYRRLVSFLARRGYEGAVARRAAASALRPEMGAEGFSEG
ncbi:MAG TPA: regulatory protein RecX [Actinomycetota bacterium]|nr:regulatory protein RecX [Actinomycetota bacterium]